MYYKSELADAVIERQKADAALNDAIANKTYVYVKGDTETVVKWKTREVQVPVYLPLDKVSKGFVEFYNAAVENRELAPLTAEEANAPSDKTLRDVGQVSNKNYTNCNRYIMQITTLQGILEEVRKSYK